MSTQVTEFAIVKAIMVKLQLGDAGKLGSFFAKQVKNAEKSIRDLDRNKTTLKNQYNDDVQDVKDQIEDANEALVDAYENVSPDDVKNNAAMLKFEDTYWGNVQYAKNKVEGLEARLKELKEDHKDEIKDIDDEIVLHKERIEVLKGK